MGRLYIYLHEIVDFYGINVGKYTRNGENGGFEMEDGPLNSCFPSGKPT